MATKSRAIVFWVVGAICIFLAIASVAAARGDSAVFSYVASLLLVLAGGMFWISVMHLKDVE